MEGDFLVIENLLYGHKCSKVCSQAFLYLLLVPLTILKVFDLKGSMRSRYVQPGKEPAGESEVYLDENFLECMFKTCADRIMTIGLSWI